MRNVFGSVPFLPLAITFGLSVSACGGGGGGQSTTTTPPPPVAVDTGPELLSDVQYKTGNTETGDIPLLLDIYKSSNLCNANRPVLLYIHGGGFTDGDKASLEVPLVAEGLNARNIDVVSIDYRLVGDNPVLSPSFQTLEDDFPVPEDLVELRTAIFAAKEDAVDALRWMEDNAAANCLDISQLAIGGLSAGAVTALRVAYGLNDTGITRPEPLAVANIFGTLVRFEDLEFREAPFITFHGQQDDIIPFEASEALAARADAVGVPYSYYLVEDSGHDPAIMLLEYEGETLLENLFDFVEAHVVGGTANYRSVLIE